MSSIILPEGEGRVLHKPGDIYQVETKQEISAMSFAEAATHLLDMAANAIDSSSEPRMIAVFGSEDKKHPIPRVIISSMKKEEAADMLMELNNVVHKSRTSEQPTEINAEEKPNLVPGDLVVENKVKGY